MVFFLFRGTVLSYSDSIIIRFFIIFDAYIQLNILVKTLKYNEFILFSEKKLINKIIVYFRALMAIA